uniref:Uncharacterized protein n=1 Tax=Oryza punctata TaxID=4537 RepID=A0A0E0M0F1_ORYPU
MQPSHFPTQRVARLLQNLRSKGTSEPSQNSTVKQVHAGGWYGDKQWVRDKPPMLQRSLSHMHDLVNIAEWWVHDDAIARLLQEAKDAAYCADDLLDELKYYELHYNLDAIQYQFRECYEEIKKDIQEKIEEIDHLINQMGHLRLRDMRQLFIYELAFIPKVDPFAEKAIVGREEDLTKLIRLLDLQGSSSACEAEINRARPENVSVLPVVGSGGVGKTALVHHIFSEKRVQDHFDQLIWMHTSEGFDEKKLITRLIWSLAENEMRSDDLSCLQRFLSNGIIHHSKRLLLVLDDVQEDVCKEDLNGWRSFLAPLKCARSGSTVLVTTRSLKVAEHLGTMKPFVLDGLTYESLWELFRMNAFGSDNSKCNQELGGIGRRIVARLNGSSLGAKILGRLLTMKLDAIYWENILESELWDMPHREMIGSNPALLLSYQYMPSHLRHCFSFCSLYPKDYNLEAEILVNCWVAVGLVAPDGDTLAADIGHLYFQQLVGRSFLQRVTSSKYVMHGLLYDMAQRISSNECFVIKGRDDFLRLPPKVRHVSILGHSGLCSSDLESLKAYTTLRSVVCISIDSNVITTSVLETWFYHLTNLRMLRFISCRLKELPGNVGSLILLRYLDISSCDFEALPDSFWRLDNIEILDAKNCRFHCVPKDIVKLVNLRKVKLKGDLMNQLGCISGVGKLMLLQEMPCYAICDSPGRGIEELKNLNNLRGALEISGIHNVTSKEQAAEADLDKKIHLNTLVLSWHDSLRPDKHNSEQEMEVLEGLRPSPSIKNLELASLRRRRRADQQQVGILARLFITETGSNSSSRGSSPVVFRSLTKLSITWCRKLMSLDNLLLPELLPEIKVIRISNCEELASLPTNQLIKFTHLEDLEVSHCWSLSWEQGLTLPSSLESLKLEACGELTDSLLRCGLRELPVLVSLELQFCSGVECIGGEIWSGLPSLQRLKIFCCQELSSIGGRESIARVEMVDIRHCPKLRELEQPFQRG